MSERVAIVDVRPIATRGWTVATAEADPETGKIECDTFPLVGWAICREKGEKGTDELEGPPFVLPCWYRWDELTIGETSLDVFSVLGPDEEPDWAALKRGALLSMTAKHRAKVARDGR